MPKGEPFSCTRDCKPITNVEAAAILRLTTAFDLSIRQLHKVLQTCNDHPCVHYKRGHPIFCHKVALNATASELCILRAASAHHRVPRSFLIAFMVTCSPI